VFSPQTAEGLRALGHTVNLPAENAASGRRSSDVWGSLQAVSWDRDGNRVEAGSDPRNPVGKGKVEMRGQPPAREE